MGQIQSESSSFFMGAKFGDLGFTRHVESFVVCLYVFEEKEEIVVKK